MLAVYLIVILLNSVCSQNAVKSILYRIQHENQFTSFEQYIRNNKDARFLLFNEELTVFIPTNVAFAVQDKPVHSNAVFYHMSFDAKTISELSRLSFINSTNPKFPPLWISHYGNDIFMNNAKIITKNSNYETGSRGITSWHQQVLHVVDEVLVPYVTEPEFVYDAYNLMNKIEQYNIEKHSLTSFYHKIKVHKLYDVFRRPGGHTFFIPVDNGIEPYKLNQINKYVIYGHVIPNYVLFTRTSLKDFNYESLANDNYVYIVLSFTEIDGKMYIKGNTVAGNDENRRGEFLAEIIEANIPVKNGVVHLISQPLGILNRTLKPFPYLQMKDKISNDPTFDDVYDMGEKTGFNKLFDTKNVSFTYFVPGEMAWKNMRKNHMQIVGDELDFLKRHLVISEMPYSIEKLVALSRMNGNSGIDLHTVAGKVRVNFDKIGDDYYVKWAHKYIKILKYDYECSDGIVHVLAGPLANLKYIYSEQIAN